MNRMKKRLQAKRKLAALSEQLAALSEQFKKDETLKNFKITYKSSDDDFKLSIVKANAGKIVVSHSYGHGHDYELISYRKAPNACYNKYNQKWANIDNIVTVIYEMINQVNEWEYKPAPINNLSRYNEILSTTNLPIIEMKVAFYLRLFIRSTKDQKQFALFGDISWDSFNKSGVDQKVWFDIKNQKIFTTYQNMLRDETHYQNQEVVYEKVYISLSKLDPAYFDRLIENPFEQ